MIFFSEFQRTDLPLPIVLSGKSCKGFLLTSNFSHHRWVCCSESLFRCTLRTIWKCHRQDSARKNPYFRTISFVQVSAIAKWLCVQNYWIQKSLHWVWKSPSSAAESVGSIGTQCDHLTENPTISNISLLMRHWESTLCIRGRTREDICLKVFRNVNAKSQTKIERTDS